MIFTPGCTHSLNYVIKGLLEPGDRAAVSTMEHNAVLRPLKQMERWGVAVDYPALQRTGRTAFGTGGGAPDGADKACGAHPRLQRVRHPDAH